MQCLGFFLLVLKNKKDPFVPRSIYYTCTQSL